MIAAIIQARTGSSRLPGKILKEVCGKSLLQHMIERVSNSNTLDKIIIATTTKKEDDIIVKFCKEKNLLCYRGSENDVLSRYKFAAEKFNVDTIVRLTSDTPLMHFSIIDEVVRTYINNDYDYVSNGVPLPRTYPDGINVEVFSREILDEMHANAKKPSEREHVTLFVTFQPEKYKIFRVDYKVDASKYRFNLDYDLDYKLYLITKILH